MSILKQTHYAKIATYACITYLNVAHVPNVQKIYCRFVFWYLHICSYCFCLLKFPCSIGLLIKKQTASCETRNMTATMIPRFGLNKVGHWSLPCEYLKIVYMNNCDHRLWKSISIIFIFISNSKGVQSISTDFRLGISTKRLHFLMISQIAKFMGPTWGPPGSCRPQMGPMWAPRTLLSGK